MTRARILAVAALAVPTVALAHAVVYPRTSAPGAYEKYVLRVPNERDTSTTRVEIRFPAEVRVISFADVQGWRLEVQADTARRITGATWVGSLAPERFVEFPFVAVNPGDAARLVWPVYQTYADGKRVAWVGPEDGEEPASVTLVGPADGDGLARSAYLSAGALIVSLVSLTLALRAMRR